MLTGGDTQTHRQDGDRLLLLFQHKESRLEKETNVQMEFK
jgi:hypothetical protein